VSFSHGEEELKSVFVFHQHTAPNDLEMRYLQLGGNVAELMMKRAQGDKFEQYNTLFDELKHVKVVPKQRQSKAAAAQVIPRSPLPIPANGCTDDRGLERWAVTDKSVWSHSSSWTRRK